MTFNSFVFAVFFATVLPLYWALPPARRNLGLLVASYVFYGWWDVRFLGLLAFSTVADYMIGHAIHRRDDERGRLRLLWLSLVINLGILGVFKYSGFFVDSAGELLRSLGVQANPSTLNIVLPVGISFYTFQTISYSFDVYRRRIAPATNFVTFATYVAYFPQLVAGPIERAKRLLPQMESTDRRFPDAEGRGDAARLILVGLAKKIVLADGVAVIVDDAFTNSESVGWLTLVIGVVGFSIQIYGDFSGYTDIARGVSKLLGIDLMVNFRQPYLARNITEFWRRWHISLSDWLRDYLYIPLGGNRNGSVSTYRNLAITMLLGGLWHGASWNFVAWGALHGIFLIVHRAVVGGMVPERGVAARDAGRIMLTFASVAFAWIFFRSASIGEAWDVITGIVTLQSGDTRLVDVATVTTFAFATLALDLWERNRPLRLAHLETARPILEGAVAGCLVLAIIIFSGGTPVPFIYFQF